MPVAPSFRALFGATALAAMAMPLAGLAAPVQAQTQAASGTTSTFGARESFDLVWARDANISPDGRTIVYLRLSNDIMSDRAVPSLWLVDVATGRQTAIAATDPSAACWSPDGSRLAYVAKAPGGKPQLFVWTRATGQSVAITTGDEAPGAPSWSPQGDKLAFVRLVPEAPITAAPVAMPKGASWAPPLHIIDRADYQADDAGLLPEGHSQIFVISANGTDEQALTSGPYHAGGALAWTPDGRSVIFATNRADDHALDVLGSDLYRVDLANRNLTRLTSRPGGESQPAVSPDGRRIAFTGFAEKGKTHPSQRLWVMNADGTDLHEVAPGFDRDLEHPVWSADGRSIYVGYADKGDMLVAQVDLAGQTRVVARALRSWDTDRPYTEGSFSVSRDGVVAYGGNPAPLPAEVMVSVKGRSRVLTALGRPLLANRDLGHIQAIDVVSPVDQRPIGAWMLLPPGYDPHHRYPTILEIHGGPDSAYGPNWSTVYALYARAGYVVLFGNPRGSTSYGEDFANIIQHDFPHHDYDDLMAIVDKAIAVGVADPANLFVTGGSGGGLLSAWIVGKTHRFRASMAQKPVINWFSETYGSDVIFPYMARYWFAKPAWEDPMAYWQHSPLSLVGSITTPTAVMVGEEDLRTPRGEAQQFYAALTLHHVPTLLVRIPGASHESFADRPSQLISEVQVTLDWFGKFRVPEGAVDAQR